MSNVETCRECGRLFGFLPRGVCIDCQDLREQRFQTVKDYLRAMRRRHPFSAADGTYAMLGGWSWCFNWCYGIDEAYPWHLLELPLVVLTLEDSEPWIEVFDAGQRFEAYSRIT